MILLQSVPLAKSGSDVKVGTGIFRRRSLDSYVIPVAILGIWLFAPLRAAGLPQAPDAFLHFYRAVAWRLAVGEGVWWPRWDTLLYQGYGYPLFNYYAPLLYLATGLLALLVPSVEAAFKIVLLLACLAYPLGMYLWARAVLGRPGAFVAAAAYTFAAYRFRELYFLGGYAQFLAFGLYPWVLFFCRSLVARPTALAFAGLSLSTAAVLLSHNISAMLFAPVLLAYAGCLALSSRRLDVWIRLGLAGACAMGISAVFWLPALGEVGYVRVTNLTQGIWDVAHNFLRPSDFVAPSLPLDDRAVNPVLPFTFGPLTLALSLAGALTLLHPIRATQRMHTIFSVVGLAATAFMMLPPSLPVWRAVPGLNLTEYPWRMFGPALLFSSFLTGASLLWLEGHRRLQWTGALATALALILAVAAYQFPRPFVPAPARAQAYLTYERAFRTIGTTAAGEYLPRWVQATPDGPALTQDLARQALAPPLPGQTGEVTAAGPQQLRARVQLTSPGPVTIAQFYFPGWQAAVDGRAANIVPAPGSGLIQVDLTSGDHDLVLTFGDTPVRRAASAVAAIALMLTMLLAWLLPRRASALATVGGGRQGRESPEVAVRSHEGWLIAGILAAFLALGIFWVGPRTSLFRLASPPGQVVEAKHQADLPVGDRVRLLGYDLESQTATQDGEVRVRLYWQTLAPLQQDYSSYVQLLAGPAGAAAGQSDHQHPGNIPTSTWTPERFVIDEHVVHVAPDAPVVPVRIEAGLYNRATGERLGSTDLPQRLYVEPKVRPDLAGMDRSSASRFDDHIRLLGHRLQRKGDALELTLFWQADRAPRSDYQVFVHILDAAGQMVVQSDGAPVAGLYPTSSWRVGDLIADVHRISLPAGASPALIRTGLYELSNQQRLAAYAAGGEKRADGAVTIHVN